ncbi:DNA-3-methyladenine glycosylase I [Myxococcus stipitatus]|uniref:DNA-3-methyladenine glycosylase I n=1 Tax=Myxococcus stipitatus TaxID=83455 RepID=UPI0030D55E12
MLRLGVATIRSMSPNTTGDERMLFGVLIFEGAQAGLPWNTVPRKRERYRTQGF